MRPRAYYNDNDPFVVEQLRCLIKKGQLPDGEVDGRSVLEVVPADVRPFRQCHFFAGIGGWPLALELAGGARKIWRGRLSHIRRVGRFDDLAIWTASLPCQPLSVAGARQGAADERHIWPAFFRLVAECAPPILIGEQVASKDGREWLAGVRLDLESLRYACGAANLPAAGVRAPHKRERLFWGAVADPDVSERRCWQLGLHAQDGSCGGPQAFGERADGALADARHDGRAAWSAGSVLEPGAAIGAQPGGDSARVVDAGSADQDRPDVARPEPTGQLSPAAGESGGSGGVADAEGLGRRGRPNDEDGGRGQRPSADRGPRRHDYCRIFSVCHEPNDCDGNDCWLLRHPDAVPDSDEYREILEYEREWGGGLGDASGAGLSIPERQTVFGERRWSEGGAIAEPSLAGFWDDAEWRVGADGKARRVKPGVRLLVAGFPNRVGALRGLGNAVIAILGAEFIEAFLDAVAER